MGCLLGGVLLGMDPASGLASVLVDALGTEDFVWVMLIEVAIGVMIAFYYRAGVIHAFADWAARRIRSRRSATGFAWGLGILIFFSDYFSPLFGGPIARPLTDRYRVSREKLAYLLDSGSAPVIAMIPFSGWAVYVSGLMVGNGPIDTLDAGVSTFIRAIPFNLYSMLAVSLAGLVAFGVVPNYGTMRAAERRARDTGKVLRDDATPLTGDELAEIEPLPGRRGGLVAYLFVPVVLILSVGIGTFVFAGSARILEAFLSAVIYLGLALGIGGHFEDVTDAVEVAIRGVKGVFPAIVILALAYAINGVSRSLGAQEYIVSVTEDWMTAGMVPVITFATGAVISFFTGTSWGTYAILTPFVLPVALNLSGDVVGTAVLATVGALVGGALFGDHCSPVSDTTVLSSLGAGSDHMDHVTTQLPYALTAGAIAATAFLAIGMLA